MSVITFAAAGALALESAGIGAASTDTFTATDSEHKACADVVESRAVETVQPGRTVAWMLSRACT
ncbi:MAG TPA: hypothetical protein VF704_08105 [Allosphingosinicella sp.]